MSSLYDQSGFNYQGVHLDDRFLTIPRHHQLQTIEWMLHRESSDLMPGGFVLSDMGVGKTLAVIYACLLSSVDPTLVVCPAHLVSHWYSQILQHTTVQESDIMVYHGPKRKAMSTLMGARFVITTYGIVAAEHLNVPESRDVYFPATSLLHHRFHRTVLDECHYIKNRTSKAFTGCKALVSTTKWFVSGTPICNRADEIFPTMHLLGHPFAAKWNTFQSTFPSWSTRGTRSLQQIMVPLTIRHDKSLLNLPVQTEHRVLLQLNPEDREFYTALQDFSRERARVLTNRYQQYLGRNDGAQRMRTMSNILTLILRLRQAACDWRLVCGRGGDFDSQNRTQAVHTLKFFHENRKNHETCAVCSESDAAVISVACGHKLCGSCWMEWLNRSRDCPVCRKPTHTSDLMDVDTQADDMVVEQKIDAMHDQGKHSTKTLHIMDALDNLLQSDRSTVVCSQWVQHLNILQAAFVEKFPNVQFVRLTGEQLANRRHEIVREFQGNSNIKVCFASLGASSEGITLTRANAVIHADLFWHRSKMDQMSARVHRIGQTLESDTFTLVVEDTIEEKIEQLILKKSAVCGVISEGKALTAMNTTWLNQVVNLIG